MHNRITIDQSFNKFALDVEDQGGVGRDGSGNSLGSVAHVWTDGQLGSLALRHLGNPIVPASNDLTKQ